MIKDFPCTVQIHELDRTAAREFLLQDGVFSAIGHVDTAAIVANELRMVVKANRCTVTLNAGDVVIVAQYIGERLPEGTTLLPKDSVIKWFHVQIEEIT